MKIDQLREKELQNPEFAKGYTIVKEKLASAVSLYKAGEAAGLTQKELTEKAGTT
jgi:hypothetical protein